MFIMILFLDPFYNLYLTVKSPEMMHRHNDMFIEILVLRFFARITNDSSQLISAKWNI